MNKKLTFLLALTFLFLFSGSVYGDDWWGTKADEAKERGDYKEMVKWNRVGAEKYRVAGAQSNLGNYYLAGQGVRQSFKEAVKWYRLAAEQGYPYAQRQLGLLYAKGQGVTQDYVLAHMWWNTCASNEGEGCVKNRSIVERKMSLSQIEKAQEMARNWKPTKQECGAVSCD